MYNGCMEEEKLNYMLKNLEVYRSALTYLVLLCQFDIEKYNTDTATMFSDMIKVAEQEFEKIKGRKLTKEEKDEYGIVANRICMATMAKLVMLGYKQVSNQCRIMGDESIRTSADIDKLIDGMNKAREMV